MQATMTIPNLDLILNPFTRAFYTDYVGELKFFNKRLFPCAFESSQKSFPTQIQQETDEH